MKKEYKDKLPINYVFRTSSIPLDDDNFKEADTIAFSVFTLIDIENVGIPKEGEQGFKTYGDIIKNQNLKHGNDKMGFLLPPDLNVLLRTCGESLRYKDIRFHSLFNKITDTTQSTFLIGDITDKTSIVIFGGTDDTVVGWIEDFDLMISHDVECLKNAKEYAERNCIDPNRQYIFVGHSKGGMEACYTMCSVKKEIQDRVKIVYDLDGPGFDKWWVRDHIMDEALDKIVLICPQESFVGRLFYQPVPPIVIKSIDKNLNQHNPTGWLIEGDEYIKLNGFTRTGTIKAAMAAKFINGLTKDDKKKFVKGIEKIASSNGAKTLTELMLKPIEILHAVRKLNSDEKKLLFSAPGKILKDRVSSAFKVNKSRRKTKKDIKKTRKKEKAEEESA